MRNTSKSFNQTIATIQYLSADGEILVGTLELNGRKSENAILIAAQKQFGNNCFVESVEYIGTALKLSANGFYQHSEPCENGVSYGHDFVIQSFKSTEIDARFRDDDGMHDITLVYYGTTTARKARNFACEVLGTKNVLVMSTRVVEQKRYMTKARYAELAQAEADAG